jgi:hypothetical protein
VHEDPVPAWPPRWELTAPESHVLSFRGGTWRGEAIRLALTELVARRILSLERVELTRRRQAGTRWALTDGPAFTQAVEQRLDAVLDVVQATPRRSLGVVRDGSTMAVAVEGVLVKDLKRSVRKAFRHIDGYRERHVAPALVDRGLLWVKHPRGHGTRRSSIGQWPDVRPTRS